MSELDRISNEGLEMIIAGEVGVEDPDLLREIAKEALEGRRASVPANTVGGEPVMDWPTRAEEANSIASALTVGNMYHEKEIGDLHGWLERLQRRIRALASTPTRDSAEGREKIIEECARVAWDKLKDTGYSASVSAAIRALSQQTTGGGNG